MSCPRFTCDDTKYHRHPDDSQKGVDMALSQWSELS
jgi:hypothetical protein